MKLVRGAVTMAGVALLAVAAAAHADTRAPEAPAPQVHKKVVIFRSGGSWLGVQLADVDADRARELGMKEEMGAEIQSVSPGSPAAEAGLQEDDVILEYQGTRIEGVTQLTRLVRETPPGRSATLRVFRDGAARTVQVKVGERSGGEAPHAGRRIEIGRGDGRGLMHWTEAPEPPEPPEPMEMPEMDLEELEHLDIPGLLEMRGIGGRPRLGAIVDDVGPQLAEFFGLKGEGGVLVKSVHKGSAGDTAGLKAGDIIVKVDDEAIEDTSDLSVALRGRRDREIRLTVVRDRREQAITVPPAADGGKQTPRPRRPGRAPAAMQEDIERSIERALLQADAARAAASIDGARALEQARRALEGSRRAVEAHREALERVLRDADTVAPEPPADGEDVTEEGVAAPVAPRIRAGRPGTGNV